MRSEYKKSVISASIGAVIFVLGLIVFISFPALYQFILDHELPLKPDSKTFVLWRDLPLPLYFNVYMYNITNPEEFLKYGSPPKLEEIGPYVYKTVWTKEDIVWNNNGTVSFREHHNFFFLQDHTNRTEDDVITTLNAPLVITANFLRTASVFWKAAISGLFKLRGEKLFIQRTVRQLLFEGYNDLLMAIAPLIDKNVPDMHGKFLWLFGKNATNDGLFTVYTGKGDLSKFNVISRWNGEEYLKYWNGKTCNMMNGTNAEVNPPVKKDQQKLSIFRSDLCRSWSLTYNKTVGHYGLDFKRFAVTRDVLENGKDNPDNECFTIGEELPSGAYDASRCLFGAPLVISLPHFYLADPSYLEAVEGLNPNKSLHDFFIDVEPVSGASIEINARMQINMNLRKIDDITIFEDLKNESIIMPVFWEEVVALLPENKTKELIATLYNPKYYVGITCYCLFAIGGVVALGAGIFLIISWWRIKQELDDDDSLIDDDEPATNGRLRKGAVETADDSPILHP